ncbi:MAG TPA: hypothetical protein VIV82_09825 [Verrucomicrobiae bacterium]|jgi:hypothetical protein
MENHRNACQKLAELVANSSADVHRKRIAVGVDECVNHISVWSVLKQLLISEQIFLSTALWQEARILNTGERIRASGGTPTGDFHHFDLGFRPASDSFSDCRVVNQALALLLIYQNVVILSANTSNDIDGLRRILHRDVAPVLNATTSHGSSLRLLLKRPKTRLLAYACCVGNHLASEAGDIGFHEIKL